MKSISFLFMFLLSCIGTFGQSTDLSDEAMQHFKRAGTAVKMAEEAEDYKIAVDEYKKVLEFSPKDADVWYRLAVCCEAVAQVDKSFYKQSADAYRNALLYGENLLNDETKKELKEKIEEMDYSATLAAKQKKNEISPSNLCGVWHFHDSSGKTDDLYDIVIKENAGFYSVDYLSFRIYYSKDRISDDNIELRDHRDVTINENNITFTTIHNKSIKEQGKGGRELCHFKIVLNYSLRLENGRLVGAANIEEKLDATGHSDYRRVIDAVKDGKGIVFSNCSGDCGSINVYFTR